MKHPIISPVRIFRTFLVLLVLLIGGNLITSNGEIPIDNDFFWARTYGGPSTDLFRDFIRTSDFGFAVLWEAQGNDYARLNLAKTNDFGDIQWEYVLGNNTYLVEPSSLHELTNGNIIVIARAGILSNMSTIVTVSLDRVNGEVKWMHSYEVLSDPRILKTEASQNTLIFLDFEDAGLQPHSHGDPSRGYIAYMLNDDGEMVLEHNFGIHDGRWSKVYDVALQGSSFSFVAANWTNEVTSKYWGRIGSGPTLNEISQDQNGTLSRIFTVGNRVMVVERFGELYYNYIISVFDDSEGLIWSSEFAENCGYDILIVSILDSSSVFGCFGQEGLTIERLNQFSGITHFWKNLPNAELEALHPSLLGITPTNIGYSIMIHVHDDDGNTALWIIELDASGEQGRETVVEVETDSRDQGNSKVIGHIDGFYLSYKVIAGGNAQVKLAYSFIQAPDEAETSSGNPSGVSRSLIIPIGFQGFLVGLVVMVCKRHSSNSQ